MRYTDTESDKEKLQVMAIISSLISKLLKKKTDLFTHCCKGLTLYQKLTETV